MHIICLTLFNIIVEVFVALTSGRAVASTWESMNCKVNRDVVWSAALSRIVDCLRCAHLTNLSLHLKHLLDEHPVLILKIDDVISHLF